jgi:hypothetical protein
MDYQMKLFVGKSDSRIEIDTVPQVMATASPVFDRMLQPDRFLEGQKLLEKKPFTVSLVEDDPSAMKVICDILHYRADSVPVKEMTLTLLASIATVVDKYDCALAIQPWPKSWLSHMLSLQPSHSFETMTAQELAMWIHISCHLGYEDQFRECTSSLIRKLPPCGPRGNQPIRGYKLLSGTVRGKSSLLSARNCLLILYRCSPKCPRQLYSLVSERLLLHHQRYPNRSPLQKSLQADRLV